MNLIGRRIVFFKIVRNFVKPVQSPAVNRIVPRWENSNRSQILDRILTEI